MATVTERLRILIESTAAGAVSDIKKVGTASEEVAAKQTLLQKASGTTTGALKGLGLQSITAGTAMSAGLAAGALVAGSALTKFALEGVEKFSDLTAEVRAFQRVTGTTAEDASRLAAAVRMTGVDAKSAETGFFQLERRIGQGKDTLAQYGAEVVRNHDGSVNFAKTLESAAAAFQGMNSADERAAFLMENFGRGGAALIPILQKTRGELEAMFGQAAKSHEIFTQEDLNRGKEYAVTMRELNAAFEGLKVEIGREIVPALTDMASTLTTVVHIADSAKGAFGGLGARIGEAGIQTLPVVGSIYSLGKTLGSVVGLFDDGSGSVDKFADAQKKYGEATAKAASLAAAGKKDTQGYKDAINEAQAALKIINGAQKDVNDSLDAHPTKQQKATAAILDYIAALDKQTRALEDSRKAQQELDNALLGVPGALLNVQQAQLDVTQAQDDYNKAVDEFGPNSDEAKAASLRLQGAQQDLTRKVLDLDIAQQVLNQTLGTQTPAQVEAARNSLIDLANRMPEYAASLQPLIDQLGRVVFLAGLVQAATNARAAASLNFGGLPHLDENGNLTFASGGFTNWPASEGRLAILHGQEAVFNQDQLAALSRVLQAPVMDHTGPANGFSVNQTIYTAEPRATAAETVRLLRSAAWLAGR